MKSVLRIAGLCLAAVLAMSMVAAGTASAALHWLHCVKVVKGSWSDSQCSVAGGSEEFEWAEVTGSEKVISHGSLALTDIKVPVAGTVTVNCTGSDEGTVGPGGFDRITEINEIKCTAGTNCEKLEKAAVPRHLPWQTELFETESTIRDKITGTPEGKGEPGWAVSCKVLGVVKEDECTTETGSTVVVNTESKGSGGKHELLVLTDFNKTSGKAKCSVGGANAGEVAGTIALLQANGNGLKVSP